MNDETFEAMQALLSRPALRDVPMSSRTSYGIGGPAGAIAEPAGADELVALVKFLRENKISYRPLGDGTNLLVKDGGFDGVFISPAGELAEMTEIEGESEVTCVRVGAAVKTKRLRTWCRERELDGGWVLTGVPGSFGGALAMNAGTANDWIGNWVTAVTIITENGALRERTPEQLEFGYRSTALKTREIILSADLALPPLAGAEIDERTAVIEKKRERQPKGVRTCGSVFKNPQKGPSAGQLIDEAGLKGTRVRGACISETHANFIENIDGADAADVLALVRLARDKVKEIHGVELELEMKVLGDD